MYQRRRQSDVLLDESGREWGRQLPSLLLSYSALAFFALLPHPHLSHIQVRSPQSLCHLSCEHSRCSGPTPQPAVLGSFRHPIASASAAHLAPSALAMCPSSSTAHTANANYLVQTSSGRRLRLFQHPRVSVQLHSSSLRPPVNPEGSMTFLNLK